MESNAAYLGVLWAKPSVHSSLYFLMSPSLCTVPVVGGLLSAHLLSKKAGVEVEAGWPCSGPLLRMAEEAARKLLPGEYLSRAADLNSLCTLLHSRC